jgi:quercetin dioxygenase-like cupin family protein
MAEPLDTRQVRAAEVVLACDDLDPTLQFFTRLGFRVDVIFPADSPAVAVLSGHGLTVRLEPLAGVAPATLRLLCDDPAVLSAGVGELVAPNGTVVQLVAADPGVVLPPVQQSFVVNRVADDPTFGAGRAGMQYRELIPGRQGGRFIGSHIRIPDAGPVPDYVHYHKVRFQMIYCVSGWVRLVYEDQGEPFVLAAGDCVLQPPQIRHRVLEASAGLEVVEIGCPAEHETLADHDMALPTGRLDPGRDFGGQRFVHHIAADATWGPWRHDGFECRNIGFGAATDGLAGARVVRPVGRTDRTDHVRHHAELVFGYVLAGSASLEVTGHDPEPVGPGDSFVLPADTTCAIGACTPDFELLDVTLPDEVPLTRVPLTR